MRARKDRNSAGIDNGTGRNTNNGRQKMKDGETVEIMGYTFKKTQPANSHDGRNVAYHVTGKRSARYFLVRTVYDRDIMFVVNPGKGGVIVSIRGNSTWTDKGGELRPVNSL